MELILPLIKSIPALLLIFLIWPMTLGAGLGLKKNIDRYIVGFCSVQAVFYLVYFPAVVFSWSSRTLVFTAAAVITLVSVAGAGVRLLKADDRKEFLALNKPDLSILKSPFFICALLVIAYEMWTYAVKEPYIYGDDVTYVRLITNFIDTDTIYVKYWAGQAAATPIADIDYKYVFTSYYPFLGMISILTGLHPLVLCKTVIPLIYIPVHYLIVWRIGSYLFGEAKEKRSLFLFFYAVLIEFGQISYYALSRRVTIWIYNSKSDCFCLLLIPLFFYTYILLKNEPDTAPSKIWQRLLIIGTIALACNSSSLMGMIMSGMIIGIWAVIIAFRSKKASVLFTSLFTLVPHAITALLILKFIGWFG